MVNIQLPSLKPLTTYQGFSLLELIIVVCLIAILFVAAMSRYESYEAKTKQNLLVFQANTFARTIENIKAVSVLYESDQIDLGNGVVVVLNDAGWPYTTLSENFIAEQKASANGCKKLWQSLFTQSSVTTNIADFDPTQSKEIHQETQRKSKINYNFEVSLIGGRYCRYALDNSSNGSYFFDYDLLTGKVLKN